MGAYVSKSECLSHYNVTINCDFKLNGTDDENFVGIYEYGHVPADGDVAGVGIVSMFIGVTSLALVLSAIDLLWAFAKVMKWKTQLTENEKRMKLGRTCGGLSLSRLLEALVLSCSDQQVFTGGAYAITLRYWKGCSITAYHYSIVANMMLLTCATHLLSVAIVKDYWRYPWLAILRIIIITGVFTFTGLLLTNQNADSGLPFPSKVPPANERNSALLMLAACFQGGSGLLPQTILQSFESENSRNAFVDSTPGNRIEGWNFFLIILLCYGAAMIVEAVRFIRRSTKRVSIVKNIFSCCLRNPSASGKSSLYLQRFIKLIYGLYLLGCVGVSGVTIGFEAKYMMDLRTWVHRSGWLEKDEWGKNEEQDGTSFGQLVPVFLGLLTLFTFAEMISSMRLATKDRLDQGHGGEKDTESGSPNIQTSHYEAAPSQYSLPIKSLGSTVQPLEPFSPVSSQIQENQSPSRPQLSNRDTMTSGAPLLGSPETSLYTPSRHDSTPAFPSAMQPSDMTSYSSYFPVHQDESPSSGQSPRHTIARRPVGSSSPDLGQDYRVSFN